jgi:hypothetical protein
MPNLVEWHPQVVSCSHRAQSRPYGPVHGTASETTAGLKGAAFSIFKLMARRSPIPNPEDAGRHRAPSTCLFVSTDPNLGEEAELFKDKEFDGQPVKHRDLRDLAGSWIDDPGTDEALSEQRQNDPELWR